MGRNEGIGHGTSKKGAENGYMKAENRVVENPGCSLPLTQALVGAN